MAEGKLPRTAYELQDGEVHVPWTAGQDLPELTVKAVLTGALLGILFGAANTYLGLKAGLTISTSIPVAVLTVVAFRGLGAVGVRHSILEANLSQTVGSASSSVASGVLFTVPALFIWGMRPAWAQLTLLALAGAGIGVLCMVPLRRYLIVREHGKLPYPEGTACAEVLVASETGGSQAAGVFWGLGTGIAFKILTDGLKLVPGKLSVALPLKAHLAVSVSPALIGVGTILGVRIAGVMVAGGALSALVLIPGIGLWGAGLEAPLFPEPELLVRDMDSSQIWNRYVRYIGAGAVATGGLITLIQSIPTMLESFRLALQNVGRDQATVERTDRDLSIVTVGGLVLALLTALALTPGVLGYLEGIGARIVAAVCIGVFAFFFVTVSSRIVGLVGQTSNPTSGMTIATLLGTSGVFYAMGWTDLLGKATALMVGTAVCIAASIAGDASQDLKTGYILGATPRSQQIGELIGVLTSAGFVCVVVMLLHDTVEGGLGGAELPAPQAMLMKLVIDGVLDQDLPWAFIALGVAIAGVAALARVPVLAFAVGVYLPLSTMAAVFLGGLLRWALSRKQAAPEAERRRERGVLFGSGLVGGGGLAGVLLALAVAVRGGQRIEGLGLELHPLADGLLALVAVVGIAALTGWFATSGKADEAAS